MKLKIITVVVAASIGLTACSSMWPSSKDAHIQFNYQTENGVTNGVIQVFDIGANTAVQIKGFNPSTTLFVNDAGRVMPYKIYGQSIVFNEILDTFKIVGPKGTSLVVRKDSAIRKNAEPVIVTKLNPQVSPMESLQAEGVSAAAINKHKNDSPEALQTEIERLRAELSEIKELIQKNSPSEKTEEAIYTVQFKNNSTQFEPDSQTKTELLGIAKDAKSIQVKGFTDSSTSTPMASSIAQERANSAKAFLVANGVNSQKIKVTHQSSGGFVANNSTAKGKAANRRVESNIFGNS